MADMNQIHIGPHGTFQEFGAASSTPQNVDEIIAHIERNQVQHVGIYLHGGLVNEKAGQSGAAHFRDVFAGAGNYGISLVWETGWWETIRKNLLDIFSTKLFQKIVETVVKKVTGYFTGLGAKGPGDGEVEAAAVLNDPAVDKVFADQAREQIEKRTAKDLEKWRAEIAAELEVEIEADREFQKLYDDPDERTPHFDDPTQPAHADPQEPKGKSPLDWFSVAWKIAGIAWRVGKRFWNGRDHGLHATAVEEVFREFYLADLFKSLEWDNMKQAAREMWLPNAGLTGIKQHAGTYLLEKLIQLRKSRPELTIDLVAHSAGAIVTCELFAVLRERYPQQLPIRNVIFLAPASTSLHFYGTMLAGKPQYQHFYMFTMPDDLERVDAVLKPVHAVFGVVYPGSLLYVVSGMLEEEVDEPLLGMVRYGSGKAPYDSQKLEKILRYLEGKERLILSSRQPTVPPKALASLATSHGAFSSEKTTMDSIQFIIKRSNGMTP